MEEGAGDFVRRPRREALRRSAAEARQGVQMEVSTEAGCWPCRVGGGGGAAGGGGGNRVQLARCRIWCASSLGVGSSGGGRGAS